MKRIKVATVAFLLAMTACGGGAANERQVFVDFSHDEFSSFMLANFPGKVTVAQGDSIVFKQIWTGEPHTVTGGTLVNELMPKLENWLGFFETFDALLGSGADIPNPDDPPDVPASDFFDAIRSIKDKDLSKRALDAYTAVQEEVKELPTIDESADVRFPEFVEIVERESDAAFEGLGLPWALDEDEDGSFVAQNAGQPCFLTKGGPPKDPKKSCTDAQQRQPAFDGTQTYYNSGIIPYEGPQGNTFKVDLADDIEPASYFFYCAVHGPDQQTEVVVKEAGSEIPDQEAVNRQARKEIAAFAKPMLAAFKDAKDGTLELDGEEVEGPFAGITSEAHGSINEFVPATIRTKVDEPVTWKLMGSDHTVSFDVPEYFPVVRFAENGKVDLNPKLEPPAGGSPPLPKHNEEEGEEGGGDGPPEITSIDGGTYDGEGFFSSGLFGGEPYAEYTLRFSEPGTYKYACLLHPPMVGTVEVT